MKLLGAQLLARMCQQRRTPSQVAAAAKLHVEQTERVLAGCGTIGVAKRVAAALGCNIVVHGWRWDDTQRVIDLASTARLSEKTVRALLPALNAFSACPPSVLVESLESLLFTVDGAQFVLKEGNS
jgi:hypothetical protein